MTDRRDMTEHSSDEIRREIDRTRAEMDEKANALEQKLSPGELFEDLWDRVKRGGGLSQFGDVVRDHPVPIALMGLGLGWLAIERATGSEGERLRRRHGYVEPGNRERAEGRRGPYMPDEVSLRGDEVDGGGGFGEKMGDLKDKVIGAKDTVVDAAASLKDKAVGAAGSVRDATGRTKESARHAMGSTRDAMDSARDSVGDAKERARHAMDEGRYRARRTTRAVSNMYDDHPLAMAAVVFGAGLAAGMSMPTTRVEDELMGEKADALKDEAKEIGRRTAEEVKSVARDSARAATDEIRQQSSEMNVGERAERVVNRAVETAERRTEQVANQGTNPGTSPGSNPANTAQNRPKSQGTPNPKREGTP